MSVEQLEAKLMELTADERQRFALWFYDHEESILENSSLEARFEHLAKEWKRLQGASSSIGRLSVHPVHLEILKLGPPVIPLILKDLQHEATHWYVTLRSLAGSSPVAAEDAGNTGKMREAWLGWGRERGYIH
jgi:hypothetical protein